VTRVMTLTPIRLSTPTAVPSSADCRETTEAATPAGWSPGSAWSGTVTVKGATSLSPAATVTAAGRSNQVAAAGDSSAAAVTAQRVSGACGWPSAVVAVSTLATRASPSVTANVIRRVVMTWRCTALPRDGDPSVRLLEQRERDGRAVGARLDIERGLQGQVGGGRPLPVRGGGLRGVEGELQQLLPLEPDVVGAIRVGAVVDRGGDLLARGALAAAVAHELRGPAEVVRGDRLQPLAPDEVTGLSGAVPVYPRRDVGARVCHRHLGQHAGELAVICRGVLALGERLAVPGHAERQRPWVLSLLDGHVQIDIVASHLVGEGGTAHAQEHEPADRADR